MKIRNKKTGEIREVSMNELNQYGLGGQHNKLVKYQNKGEVKKDKIKQAFVTAYNNYNNRVFPAETLPTRQKAFKTINPSDYTDLRNYGRWIANEQRNQFYDPRSEEAFKFYLGLSKPEELQYLKKSKYRPTINATDQNYYSVDSDLEQDIFNSFKDKLKLNEILQTSEAEFETPLSGKDGAGLLGRFGVSRGHDENGDYLSYYDKYDLKDFAQSRTKGIPYSIYNRIYYPKKQTGGEMIKRADGSYSRRGLWDNIRANAGSGKRPTKEMLNQERKIRNQHQAEYGMEVMGNGGVPTNPGFVALPKYVQQNIINNMATGGQKMPPQLAYTRFAAAGNLNQLGKYGYQDGGGKVPNDFNEFQEFNKTLPDNLRDDNFKYGDYSHYDLYGMWDASGKPKSFDDVKDTEFFPLQEDGYYHGFSVGNDGILLKPKSHPSAFMEFMINQLNPESYYNGHIIQREDGRLQYVPYKKKQGGNVILNTDDKKNKFNTKLKRNVSESFNYHSKLFPSLLNDSFDYDTKGFYKQIYDEYNGDLDAITKALTPNSPTQHIGTDRYKKPNHPTFSNESKYSIPIIRPGGKWGHNEEEDYDYFKATRRNIKNMNNSDGSPFNYFKRAEDYNQDGIPDVKLFFKGNSVFSKGGESVTLNAGGENHRIYVKTTNRGEGKKGHIMVNHPTMDKGMWDTIDLTKKSGATTIAQGVAATKKWHMENPYMKKYGGQPMYAYGGLVKYKEGEEVKKAEQQNVAPVVNEKSKLIFRNPVLETPCEGIGCAQLTSNELSKMNLIPSRTDAWFMGDAVVKDGGKQIWNRQSGNIDYSTLIPGDVITLDRPGYAHQSEMRNNNPAGYNPEREVEHVGVIVGHDERGVPLVKHGGNHGIRTVIQPIDKLSLYIPDSGATLEYKPFAIYRTKGAENIPIPDSYYNKQFAEFDNNTPLLKKQLDNTEKQNKMIDAFNNNLEKQSRVLNLNPYDIQQLQKIAFGIFGNESKYGTSPKQKPKEYVKRFGHFIRADKWAPFVDDETSPSLSEMRIKYGDIYGDGNSKIANQFDELGIKEKNLKGYNSDNDYNDEANAAVAILVNNYNKIKNDKDEYGRSKYNYDPTKQTVYGDIPVTEVIAKMYNSGPGIINNENKLRKKPIYAKQAIENAYTNFDEVPSLTKTFKNDVIISGGLKKPITKPLINTTPEIMIPENINPRFIYSTPPSVFANGGNVPMYGPGGFVAKPTVSDSLLLYKNQVLKDRFYKNNPEYHKDSGGRPLTKNKDIPNIINSLNQSRKNVDAAFINESFGTNKSKKELSDRFGKVVNTNIYSAGDVLAGKSDNFFNPDAPASYFSNVILPKEWIRYWNGSEDNGDFTDIPMYDPIAVKPAFMKTAADWAYMKKTYGPKPPAQQTGTTTRPPARQTINTTMGQVTGNVRPNKIKGSTLVNITNPVRTKDNLERIEMIPYTFNNPKVVPHGELLPIRQMKLKQQGTIPFYGPGNTIIGYTDDNRQFYPIQYSGAKNNQLNLQDKELLANPELLKKYVQSKDNYKFAEGGGIPMFQPGGEETKWYYPKEVITNERPYYYPPTETLYLNPDYTNEPEVVRQHELFHHLQKINGGSQRPEYYPGPLKKPNMMMNDDLQGAYWNRKTVDVNNLMDQVIKRNPDFQFYPNDLFYNKVIDGLEYDTPGTLENEAQQYEDYVRNGGKPLFTNGGGIPERYRNMGFTNVGAKKQSTRPGKKWMVLAKKGDQYKVVHGGYKGMQDFKQHHSEQRKENFWSRMGGRNSSKATDPFSPLYWHKRFGTWEYGGQPMAVGGQNVMNPIVKKDNRNWLEYLKN